MRGQITFEAIFAFGAAMILLIGLVNLSFERLHLARDVGEAGEARMIGEMLASAINNAYADGDGFSIYLDSSKLNYAKFENQSIQGIGLVLPIKIDATGRTINISKNASKTGGNVWSVAVPVIPVNITRLNTTSQYPQTTIWNNGTYVLVYADRTNIAIYRNGSRID